MAQVDFGTIDPATKSGTALADDLNDWRDSVHSSHSGTTAPSYIVEGMLWYDTDTNIIGGYNGTSTVDLFDITSGLTIPSATITTADINGGTLDGVIIGGTTAAAGTFTTVTTEDEVIAKVVLYEASQDAPYLIAATESYTGAPTNPGTHGYQHRYKINSGGAGRVTIDTSVGGVSTEVWALYNDGNMEIAGEFTADTVSSSAASGLAYSFTTDPDTGFGLTGNNEMTFQVGGTSDGVRVGVDKFLPVKPITMSLGNSSFLWKQLFAVTATISTSDINTKTDIVEISEAEARVAQVVKGLLRRYRRKSAVEEKGDAARYHFGVMAQEVVAAFEDEGLDAHRYSMICRDDTDEGERYGVRYSELLAFMIAAM